MEPINFIELIKAFKDQVYLSLKQRKFFKGQIKPQFGASFTAQKNENSDYLTINLGLSYKGKNYTEVYVMSDRPISLVLDDEIECILNGFLYSAIEDLFILSFVSSKQEREYKTMSLSELAHTLINNRVIKLEDLSRPPTDQLPCLYEPIEVSLNTRFTTGDCSVQKINLLNLSLRSFENPNIPNTMAPTMPGYHPANMVSCHLINPTDIIYTYTSDNGQNPPYFFYAPCTNNRGIAKVYFDYDGKKDSFETKDF